MNKRNIFNILYSAIGNKNAVYGIMGNLMAESALHANNLQNSGNTKLDMTDAIYTEQVDNGIYDNFVYDSCGYGLAQWTYWSRKQQLLNYAKSKGVSIGDETMQTSFIVHELTTNYKPLFNKLKACTTIQEASDMFCKEYERPANQSRNALDKRVTYGIELQKELTSSSMTKEEFLQKLSDLIEQFARAN